MTQATLYVSILSVSAMVTGLVTYFVWQRRRVSGGLPLFVLLLCLCESTLTYALFWIAPNEWTRRLWWDLASVGSLLTPLVLFIFVQYFTNRHQWITPKTLAFFSIIPASILALFITDSWHGLFYAGQRHLFGEQPYTGGPGVYLALMYSYGITLITAAMLARVALWGNNPFRLQARLILLSLLVPWASNLITAFRLSPLPGFDLTPLALTFSGLFLTFTIFRVKLIDLAPVAHDQVFETIPDVVIVLDLQDRVVDVNPAASHLLRAMRMGQPSALIGDPISCYFPEFSEEERTRTATLTAAQEITITLRDQVQVFERRVTMLRDRRSRVQGKLLMLHDITERKRTEQQLRTSELQYRMLFEQKNSAVVLIALSGEYLRVNLRAAEMFGYSVDELVSINTRGLVAPDEAQQYDNILTRLLAGESLPLYERAFVRKDGTRMIAEINVALVRDSDGKPLHIQSIMHDITARREMETAVRSSESRFRTLIELLPVGIVIHQDGYFKFLNATALKILRYSAVEELLDTPAIAMVHPDDRARVLERRALAEHGSINQSTEQRLMRSDGTTVEAEVVSLPFTLDGKAAVLAVFTDISERKLDAQRKIELASAREQRRVLEQFITDASHDLRTPLSIMQTSSYLMDKLTEQLTTQLDAHKAALTPLTAAPAPSAAEKTISGIVQTATKIRERVLTERAGVERLRLMIEAMLEMIRLDRLMHLDLTSRPLNTIAKNVLSLHEGNAARKGVTLHFNSEATVTVNASEKELGRAILEIVKNAVQFTAPGGNVTLRSYVQPSADVSSGQSGFACLEVSDTGTGIEADHLPLVFNRFFRGDSARSTQQGSNGLGLSIAHRIIELHHGEITVSSRAGFGSTFKLCLPLAQNTIHQSNRSLVTVERSNDNGGSD